jgi:hypothetical protein
MTESLFDHVCGVTAVILFIWSAALVWASWQIGCIIRGLAEERRELRRWKRLQSIYDKQRQGWQ